jgi:hypothetical protein
MRIYGHMFMKLVFITQATELPSQSLSIIHEMYENGINLFWDECSKDDFNELVSLFQEPENRPVAYIINAFTVKCP